MSLNNFIGQKVIVRTESAGVFFGVLAHKEGAEVILTSARRMWRWWAAKSISLSACAIWGIKHGQSKIVSPVPEIWLQAIEIIPCSETAIASLEGAPYVEAQ